uniref:tetrahydrofolate synthase n=1 Tax=candidate division WOR-3 bacterium TaxID=2052148 RepID=A0A7C4YFB6_UNCW3
MNFEEANKFLNSLIDREKRERIKYPESLDDFKETLRIFGNPQESFPSFIVAGTKGKGSTSFFLARILSFSGLKTGLFLSPHLVNIRERISIDGKMISEEDFAEIISEIKGRIKGDSYRSVFETLTIMAFLYFKEKKVDVAVFEVGLGGRLDATNVVNPVVSVITDISYDHTHILGKSLKSITYEKMGVTRKGIPVVSSKQKKIVRDYIKEFSKSDVTFVGIDTPLKVKNISLEGTEFSYCGEDYSIKMIGEHQAMNASVAIEALKNSHFYYEYEKGKEGLKDILFPGRFHIIKRNPLTIIDGAHNLHSMKVLVSTYKDVVGENPTILFSCLKRKPYRGMLDELSKITKKFILTSVGGERRIDKEKLIKFLMERKKNFEYYEEVEEAYKNLLREKSPYLITGSLYLAGKILEIEGWGKNQSFF